jgi:hypothetical protein
MKPWSSALIPPAPGLRIGSTTNPAPAFLAGLSDPRGVRRQPHRNVPSAAQPRPAPPIAHCSHYTRRRNTRRDSNRPWVKLQRQVIAKKRKREGSCRLDYCQTNLRSRSFIIIGILTIHLSSRMLGWSSELLSRSIRLSRKLPENDEKAAPEGRSSWPLVAYLGRRAFLS